MTAGPAAEVVGEHAAFDALAGEWAELYDATPTASPFQSHAWLSAWARAYVRPGRLRVVLVRSAGRLVAAAPLYQDRRGPWPVLTPLGSALADFSDVLIAEDGGPQAADALTQALLGLPGWRVLDLPEVRPDAAAQQWAGSWPGRVTRLDAATSLELPVGELADVLSRLPGRSAKVVRRKLRRVDELGVVATDVAPQDVPAAVADMLRLHHEQWHGRGMTPEHGSGTFAVHLTEAMEGMVAAGSARITEYRIDGELLASQLYVVGHGLVGSYLAGIAPALREMVDVAALMLREDLRLAVSLGVPRYSMMRGVEEYKLRWRPEAVVHERLVLARPGPTGGAGFAPAAAARRAAVLWAKARAPWLRRVAGRLRAPRRDPVG